MIGQFFARLFQHLDIRMTKLHIDRRTMPRTTPGRLIFHAFRTEHVTGIPAPSPGELPGGEGALPHIRPRQQNRDPSRMASAPSDIHLDALHQLVVTAFADHLSSSIRQLIGG